MIKKGRSDSKLYPFVFHLLDSQGLLDLVNLGDSYVVDCRAEFEKGNKALANYSEVVRIVLKNPKAPSTKRISIDRTNILIKIHGKIHHHLFCGGKFISSSIYKSDERMTRPNRMDYEMLRRDVRTDWARAQYENIFKGVDSDKKFRERIQFGFKF